MRRARPRAPSVQPRTRPTRDPRARGSSSARRARATSSYSSSSNARASSRFGSGARVFTTASVASTHQLLAAHGAREVAGAPDRSSCASASPANQPRMACTARACATQHVVVESLGELERCACMVGDWVEPGRPRQSAVDTRPERRQRRPRAGLPRAGGQSDSVRSRALQGGQVPRRAQEAARLLSEETGENRSGARPVARATLGARRASARRCRSLWASGGVSRSACSASSAAAMGAPRELRQSRGVAREQRRLSRSGRLRRKREVAGAVDRIRDDLGDASVRAPPFARRTPW